MVSKVPRCQNFQVNGESHNNREKVVTHDFLALVPEGMGSDKSVGLPNPEPGSVSNDVGVT